jgi:signal transduction histidine kinase
VAAGALEIALAAALVAAVGIFVWLSRVVRGLEARLLRAEQERDERSAILSSASDGFVVFRDQAVEISPTFRAWFGLPADSRWSDVLDMFKPADRDRLKHAAERLLKQRSGFTLRLERVGGSGVQAFGHRLDRGDGTAAMAVTWFRDAAALDRLERERAQAIEDQARSELLLEAVPWPVWQFGRGEHDPEVGNTAYARVFGSSAGASPLGGQQRSLAERAARLGQPMSESQTVAIEGKRRLFEITALPRPDGLILGFAEDMTQLAETQDELARHVALQNEVLQGLGTAVAVFGRDRRLKFFNSAYARLWRMDERWLESEPSMGEVVDHLRERRQLPEVPDFIQYKQSQNKLFTSLIEPQEETMFLPDGRTLRLTLSPHPAGGLVMTYEDVTDRLQLEASFNTLTAVQRETLDNLYEAVAAFGSDGRLALSNPAFARVWDLPQTFLDDRPHVADLVQRVRPLLPPDGGQTGFEFAEAERSSVNGRIERRDDRVLDFARVPLPDGAILLIYQDVTDTIRAERALLERNQALETADRLKSEFIANISYQLRTPLNAIIGFAELLAEQYFGPLNERQKEYAQAIRGASKGLVALINDILDLASIEAGYMNLELAPVDIGRLLAQTAQLTEERARSLQLALSLNCPPDVGEAIADERRLKQALFNLLSNAVKFTPGGGAITLSAWRQGEEIVLTVADTGIGIPAEDQARVFQRFERGPQAAQRGAGLGLALVKNLIELHGGRVELVSQPEVGTTVTCRLPRQGPPQRVRIEPATP